jgi:hypothetical protein
MFGSILVSGSGGNLINHTIHLLHTIDQFQIVMMGRECWMKPEQGLKIGFDQGE